MSLTVTTVGDNPQTPGISAETYVPDQLIAGPNPPPVTGNITLDAGTLARGTVLGQITEGAITAGAMVGTGNAAITLLSRGANALVGAYTVTNLTATTFSVTNPKGDLLTNGAAGAYVDGEINFTWTAGGTPAVAGDKITVTVAAGTGHYIESVKTAVDGSQVPSAILADAADASGGAVVAGAYLSGAFNQNAITFDASWSVATLTPLLRAFNIFLKPAVSASDPS